MLTAALQFVQLQRKTEAHWTASPRAGTMTVAALSWSGCSRSLLQRRWSIMRLDVKSSPGLTRRAAVASALAMGSAIYSPKVFAQGAKSLVLTEPVHNLGYAPVYLAVDQGLFKSRGLDVSLVVATNGAHVTALVSGQVWGNIGGPESDAMANVGKADPLRTICNLVNRANVYVVARKGTGPKSNSNADIATFLKGKRFALSRYGGTPDLLGGWLVITVGLDPRRGIGGA